MNEEIIAEILKNELLALNIYKRLHLYSNKDFLKNVWKGVDFNDYFEMLNWLIEQEKHILLFLNRWQEK